MSLLQDLINIRYLLIDGVAQVRRKGLNLIGVVATDNEDEDRIDITVMSGTTTTAPYTQPAVGATVDVAVTSTATFVEGQIVIVDAGGYYSVSVLGATSLRLTLLDAIAAPAATVTTGKSIVPSGYDVGGGAPIDARYLTLQVNGTLTQERVLVAGAGLTLTDGGANGNATLATTPWVALAPTTDYATTPASATTLTMNSDLVDTIQPGDPIRWMTSAAALTNNTLAV